VAEKRGRRHKQLLDKVKGERGYRESKNRSTRSHFVENSLWKGPWTGRKTDNRITELTSDFKTDSEIQ
jgi:hypothetical protein